MCKEKIEFPFKCPVCEKSDFVDVDWLLEEDKYIEVYTIDATTGKKKLSDAISAHSVHCEYCGWTYDLKQVLNHDVVGDRNSKSVNELKVEYLKKIKTNPDYIFDEEQPIPSPHKCPVCGEYEFEHECCYDICPICGWEDTGFEKEPDEKPTPYMMSYNENLKWFKEKRSKNPKYRWDKVKS